MEGLLHIIKRYIPTKLFAALQPIYHFLLGALAAARYGWPSNKLIVIGVTGTTGKTTTVYLIAQILKQAGFTVGFTSTAMFNDGKKEWLNDKKMTMAGRWWTQRMLKQMVKNKCQYAIIETTSEGVIQYRHRFINYDILVFTGFYPEHIESHGSFLNYRAAKGRLFAHLKHCKTKYANDQGFVQRGASGLKKTDLRRVKKTIIVNGDDEQAGYFLDFWAESKYAYTKSKEKNAKLTNDKICAVKYDDVQSDKTGVEFMVDGRAKIKLNLLGEFNATNTMNAVCLGLSQELALEQISQGLSGLKAVPGRLEVIQRQPFTVIVDYAFEPTAVAKLYEIVVAMPHSKIIHVLGSTGGGRDAARRPKLGALAGKKADIVIITNEDPYDDDPRLIIDQVATGAVKAGKTINENLFKILNRRQAISKALSLASEGDIVLITGKGCEQAICAANGEKITWDDRRVVREELECLVKWGD